MKIFRVIAFILFIIASAGASEAACTFRTAPTAMNFGVLSPANSTDATATSTVTIRCSAPGPNPYPYTMTDDDGLYESGPDQNRMQNTGNPAEYLRYSFTYAASGTVPRNTNVVFTFTGTVRAVDYQNAWLGGYSDTVTVTINP